MPSRVVRILQDLIAIPSVNPDGETGTTHTGEADCAQYVGDFCRRLGAEVSFEEVLPGRPNVIARFPSAGAPDKPRILLAPHTDTVSVAGMTIDPFGAVIRDDRIWGRGASDTKGTMAAMLAALEAIGPRLPHLPFALTFVGLMGEETAQHGSRHFAAAHKGEFDFAIVGEPTDCTVVHTHKGSWWLRLHTEGKAVHGSTPELGLNAVTRLVPVVAALDTDFRARLADPAFRHPVLGDSTLNIGMIRGGSRTNIVPDHCTVWLDIRFTPGAHRHGVPRLLETFLADHGFDGFVRIDSDPVCGPLETDPEHPLVRRLAAAGHGLTGATWFCDALWLAEIGGIPSVAAGPGSIAQAHTADEWIAIPALEAGVAFYRRFLEGA